MSKKTLKVGQIRLGAERPAIIVPITATTAESIYTEASLISNDFSFKAVDIIEWRIDHFEEHRDLHAITKILDALRSTFPEQVLLATFRTSDEGGAAEISPGDYLSLVNHVSASGFVDLVDVEYRRDNAAQCIDAAHKHSVRVVGSNHDFFGTPDEQEIVSRLSTMSDMGCDVPKIAVTPLSPEDVLVLLSATISAGKNLDRPIITMSMKEAGMASRLAGGVFGSSATFATIGAASAPGQIPVATVSAVLDAIHA
ncbi:MULTISPECIES: type I 3-dehydroquinate dehydratase [Citricoccus]|uniref:3-dehydroquinate dehydratase n=1 Tax=Citricoccus muralis TaxID=169134 RepID=A0ABY8H2L3_9MICC|nr:MULTISPECIES: type I 3-dehydroquinate dehydratase [Citricoccus]WBL18248.1 type I 3-dehydroquinate dehydratase [Citricoccus sp. NR2]WFP15366.1 type I 3-dehydroquinate dehydratase [Citricoccus muralis]